MRYAENFIDFGALVFNKGEPVSTMTSPLQALVYSFFYKLTGSTLIPNKILSIFLLFATVFLALWHFKKERYCQIIVLSVLLLSPCILLWTVGGLGTPMLMLTATALTVLAYTDKRPEAPKIIAVSIIAGLAFFMRQDSVLFTAPLVLQLFIRSHNLKISVLAALIGAIIPLTWLVVAFVYYGDILPTGYYVKPPSYGFKKLLFNATYIFQFLICVGIIPYLAFLFCFSGSKQKLGKRCLCHLRRHWGLCLGIMLVIIYGFTMATVHMMFSFRFFVPFIPALTILVAGLFSQYAEPAEKASKPVPLFRYFGIFLIMILLFQAFQAVYTFKKSLNGISKNGEFRKIGIEGYSKKFMPTLAENALDIRSHWESLNKDRPPRIFTFAAGILPYSYKEAYIYDVLSSYRHNCGYDRRLSADYIHILIPRHGTLANQLLPTEKYYNYMMGGKARKIVEKQPHKTFEGYRLISSRTIIFDGSRQHFLVYYNPHPEPNRQPPGIGDACSNVQNLN